jgi:antitoxin Phd
LEVIEEIQLKDAKASLSAIVDKAIATHKPQVITRHGRREAVLISWEDYQRLSTVPSFGRLLMSAPLEGGDIPERNRVPEDHRTVEF